jgi:AcrR family transcriptional regulator
LSLVETSGPATVDRSDPHERLLAGMVAAASSEGYGRASVARVIERAGVSRATFYEHFADRESCFLAAYRVTLSRVRSTVRAAADAALPLDRPRRVLEALLREVAADPPAARFVLFEALAAPRLVRAEHEALMGDLEAEIQCSLASQDQIEGRLQLSATALRAGVEEVVSSRLLRGEAATLPRLLPDLLAWIEAYRLSPGSPLRPERYWAELGARFPPIPRREPPPPPLLPRGRNAIPLSSAATLRRSRIIEATVSVIAAKGYADVTVADVVSAARVSRAAFYSHFNSKQDAFLAAQRLGFQESLAASAEAFFSSDAWPDRVWAGGRQFLRYIAEHPQAAYLVVAEAHAAGEAAIRLGHDSRGAYTLFLEEGYRERRSVGPPLPLLCSEAIAGATYGLLRRQVICESAERAMQLLPQLTYLTMAPFVGPERALAFIEEKMESAR